MGRAGPGVALCTPGVVVLRPGLCLSTCLPAPGGTHAPHLLRLFANHHPRCAAPRAPSYLSNTWLLWSSSSNLNS